MRHALVPAVLAAVAIGAAATSPTPARLAQRGVMVHCPAGDTAAFVTPTSLTIGLGDTVVWRTTGRTPADSIRIVLKERTRPWPFAGGVPAGRTSARTGAATARDTVHYEVRLVCRIGGSHTQVTIDPDIIIE